MVVTAHARERMLERVGIELTQDVMDEIDDQLRKGRAVRFGTPDRNSHQCTVIVRGKPANIVIEDCIPPRLVTVLPQHASFKWSNKLSLKHAIERRRKPRR
jgi:hypothetical protein